jgi:hypothetical protein
MGQNQCIWDGSLESDKTDNTTESLEYASLKTPTEDRDVDLEWHADLSEDIADWEGSILLSNIGTAELEDDRFVTGL